MDNQKKNLNFAKNFVREFIISRDIRLKLIDKSLCLVNKEN